MSPRTLFFIAIAVSMSFTVAAGAYFSKAELHPKCLKVVPTPALSTEWGLKLFAGARFYIPFGSNTAIHHISELLTGAKISTPKDLKDWCANVRIKGFKLVMDGHDGQYIVQDCAVVKKGINDCTVNPNSENPRKQKEGNGIFTIVWTDNESSMAIVRCTSDGLYNDWYVFSSEPSLNETTKGEILNSMNKLGFSDTIDDAISLSYEGCKLFDPEEED
ncbi:unnamed protein product [Orchesella dallaii]|uniref:Uncharacterized protein n=1 Tax=Orchesella dallaii TaxID=48710 RepID=A0ABP1RXI6_9HEXA